MKVCEVLSVMEPQKLCENSVDKKNQLDVTFCIPLFLF